MIMKISDLIKDLEDKKKEHGDIEVRCLTMTHSFPPDLRVKTVGDKKYLILND